MGELLALTKEKFDFKTGTVKIDEPLQRIDGKNIFLVPMLSTSNPKSWI